MIVHVSGVGGRKKKVYSIFRWLDHIDNILDDTNWFSAELDEEYGKKKEIVNLLYSVEQRSKVGLTLIYITLH